MPASSKAQQRLMGLVKAVQAGDIPKSKVTKKIKQLAKNMKQKDVKKYASTKHKNLPDKVRESKTSDMMRDIRKGGAAGPWNIIVSKNNKVVSQVSVKNLKEIPAYLAALRPRYPNHRIGIEAKDGKIVYREQDND